MRMRNIFVILLAASINSCSKVNYHDVLFYPSEFNLNMKEAGAITQFAASGLRGYTTDPDDGTCYSHSFNMNNATDKYTIVVFDNDGVQPGSGFVYNVQLINPTNLSVLWSDLITTDVAASYTQRVTKFKFIYSLGPDQPPAYNNDEVTIERHYTPVLDTNQVGFVGGTYQFTTTQAEGRYVTFNVKFDMSDPVQYIDDCGSPEVPTPP